ncbi:MAG: YciI family protein [Ramlibacter sp.]|nr:YciI family protein [Ramlibacter sp.]
MQYMLMFYISPEDVASRTDERAEAYMAGWNAYVGAMYQSGVVLSGEGLDPPSTATSLRIRGDKRSVQDGPFADTKEQLGGFFIIDVATLDAALEWAARAPCASTGGVEVRPVMVRAAS